MSTGVVSGRYRLGRQIGAGGMGRVWLARDEVLRRNVAIKEVLLPEGLSDAEATELRLRTLREARAAARLSHPSVIKIYDVIYSEDRPWIVMEYVASRSLAQTVKEDGPMPPESAARVGLAVLAALCAAHEAGVLHRDVKPGNVLLGDDGRVVLTDFGLATYDEIGTALTQSGVVHGSPQFIAPERALDGTSSRAADMWSLGATLYAAVEGRSPYSRASSYATLTALATAPPDPPQRAGSLKPVLGGLLRRNPRSRMKPDEVKSRLQRIVAADGPKPRLIPRQRKHADSTGADAGGRSDPAAGRRAGAGQRPAAPTSPTAPPTAPPTGRPPEGQPAAGPITDGLPPGGLPAEGLAGAAPPGADTAGPVAPAGSAPATDHPNGTFAPGRTPAGSVSSPRNRRAFDPIVPLPWVRRPDLEPVARDGSPAPGAPDASSVATSIGALDIDGDADTDRQMDDAWSMDAVAYVDTDSSATPMLSYLGGEDATFGSPRGRRSARWWMATLIIMIAVVALIAVVGATVFGLRHAKATGGRAATVPSGGALAPGGASGSVTTAPPGVTAALSWPCPLRAPAVTATVTGTSALPHNLALLPGWIYVVDARGFHLGVPQTWREATAGPVACFYDPNSSDRIYGVDSWVAQSTDAVTVARGLERNMIAANQLPGYRDSAIDKVLLRPGRATWEYTYLAGVTRMHVFVCIVLVTRKSITTAYAASFTSTDFDWPGNDTYYSYLQTTFTTT